MYYTLCCFVLLCITHCVTISHFCFVLLLWANSCDGASCSQQLPLDATAQLCNCDSCATRNCLECHGQDSVLRSCVCKELISGRTQHYILRLKSFGATTHVPTSGAMHGHFASPPGLSEPCSLTGLSVDCSESPAAAAADILEHPVTY